jgi:cell division protein FtsL
LKLYVRKYNSHNANSILNSIRIFINDLNKNNKKMKFWLILVISCYISIINAISQNNQHPLIENKVNENEKDLNLTEMKENEGIEESKFIF